MTPINVYVWPDYSVTWEESELLESRGDDYRIVDISAWDGEGDIETWLEAKDAEETRVAWAAWLGIKAYRKVPQGYTRIN